MADKPASRKKGGGLGAALRGMIFEEDPSRKTSSEDEPSIVASSGAKPAFGTSHRAAQGSFTPTFAPSVVAPGVDPQHQAEVERLLSERNPATYLKFSSLLSSLAAKIPDSATRFSAALATAPLMGIELSAVRAAYDERLKILDNLRQQFEEHSRRRLEDANSRFQQEVVGIDSELARVSTEIEQARAQIARLEARSMELASQKEQKSRTSTLERDSIASVETGMLSAFDAVRGKATTERDEVSRHITGV